METVKRSRSPEIEDDRPIERKKYRTLEDIIQNGPQKGRKRISPKLSRNLVKGKNNGGKDHENNSQEKRKKAMQKCMSSSDTNSENNASVDVMEHYVESNFNIEHRECNITELITLQPLSKQVLHAIHSAAVTQILTHESADSAMYNNFLLSHRNSYCFKGPLEDILDLLGYLSIKFGHGSSMPSLENLKEIFRKFGQLNLENTKISFDTYRARVVFSSASDAKKAFIYCMRENPFEGNITFDLGFAPDSNGYPGEIEATTVCYFDDRNVTSPHLNAIKVLSPKNIVKEQINRIEAMIDSAKNNRENWEEVVFKLKIEFQVLREKIDSIS